MEFAAILPNKKEFQCFFHHEYISVRLSDLERTIEIRDRSKGKQLFSESGFRKHFIEFLDKNFYPSTIFTIAAKNLNQIALPVVSGLLKDTNLQFSFTHFDPCVFLSQRSDDFILSWAKACDCYDVPIPQDALTEARLIDQMMRDHL